MIASSPNCEKYDFLIFIIFRADRVYLGRSSKHFSSGFILRFPEWIQVKKCAPAVFGSGGENPAYETSDAGAELLISSTSPPKDDYSSMLALFGPLLDSQRIPAVQRCFVSTPSC